MAITLMNDQLHVKLITPDLTAFDGNVSMVVIPGEEGDFAFMPKHAPFSSSLRAGSVRIYKNNTVSDTFEITGGFAEIINDKCQIIVDGLKDR